MKSRIWFWEEYIHFEDIQIEYADLTLVLGLYGIEARLPGGG